MGLGTDIGKESVPIYKRGVTLFCQAVLYAFLLASAAQIPSNLVITDFPIVTSQTR